MSATTHATTSAATTPAPSAARSPAIPVECSRNPEGPAPRLAVRSADRTTDQESHMHQQTEQLTLDLGPDLTPSTPPAAHEPDPAQEAKPFCDPTQGWLWDSVHEDLPAAA